MCRIHLPLACRAKRDEPAALSAYIYLQLYRIPHSATQHPLYTNTHPTSQYPSHLFTVPLRCLVFFYSFCAGVSFSIRMIRVSGMSSLGFIQQHHRESSARNPKRRSFRCALPCGWVRFILEFILPPSQPTTTMQKELKPNMAAAAVLPPTTSQKNKMKIYIKYLVSLPQ